MDVFLFISHLPKLNLPILTLVIKLIIFICTINKKCTSTKTEQYESGN